MNQKGRKWNSLYKRRGNFNVRRGTEELCSALTGCSAAGPSVREVYLFCQRKDRRVAEGVKQDVEGL